MRGFLAAACTATVLICSGSRSEALEPVEAERPGPTTITALRETLDGAFVQFAAGDMPAFAKALEQVDRGIIAGLVPQFAAQLTLQTAKSGPCRRIEFIRRESAGDAFTRFYIVAIYANCVTRWRLDFARPNNRWFLQGFNANSNWTQIAADFSHADPTVPPVEDRSWLEASETMEMVAARIQAGWYDNAVDRLKLAAGLSPAELKAPEHRQWMRQTSASFDALEKQRSLQGSQRRRFDRVAVDLLGQSIARFAYLDLSEKDAIVWEFYFIKPHDRWLFANVGVLGDDDRDRVLQPTYDRPATTTADQARGDRKLSEIEKDRR